ncbi:MAG: Rieske (2Fe-2S) protein [Calothrix sp. MO_192.B10]|nr:Rieske (2Fe-2S) protein [Calothrix sp. MO_192.B10]
MNRRDFLTWVGVGCVSTSLPVAIAACSPDNNNPPATSTNPTTPTNNEDWQKVGSVADLDSKGQLLAKNSPIGPVLIVGTSKDNNLIAVNPKCTHAGCIVGWETDSKKFLCRCHGSEFGIDGQVLKAPAKQPIPTYTAKVEGDAVLVKKV